MGSPSRNVQYHPPRLSEDRLNLPQPHSPSLPTHCTAPGNRECAHRDRLPGGNRRIELHREGPTADRDRVGVLGHPVAIHFLTAAGVADPNVILRLRQLDCIPTPAIGTMGELRECFQRALR